MRQREREEEGEEAEEARDWIWWSRPCVVAVVALVAAVVVVCVLSGRFRWDGDGGPSKAQGKAARTQQQSVQSVFLSVQVNVCSGWLAGLICLLGYLVGWSDGIISPGPGLSGWVFLFLLLFGGWNDKGTGKMDKTIILLATRGGLVAMIWWFVKRGALPC